MYTRETKSIYTFQANRSDPPAESQMNAAHLYQTGNRRRNRREFKCPNCGRNNYLGHGDRILCGCDYIIELYGNSYTWWYKSLSSQSMPTTPNRYSCFYEQVRPEDLELSIKQRLISDPIINEAAKDPNVENAIDQVVAMIKLSQNL